MTRRGPAGFALALALTLWAPAPHSASAAQAVGVQDIRSWSAPASTRIVLDFSDVVVPVAPDSGRSRELILTFPADSVVRGKGMLRVTKVADGVVDSIEIHQGAVGGTRIRFAFRDSVRFTVVPVPLDEIGQQPYRIVVTVHRPGAAAAEEQRLANIATTKRRDRIRVIAVDAGHGGEDPGARGPKGLNEKRVTLGVAKALVDELNQIKGVHAQLTRDGDYFIPLHDRYRIAERMDADVFISIHANSSKRRGRGSGTEVYFLSLRGASDQATQDLADAENAADLVGGVPTEADGELVNILYDLKRSSALTQSQLLAETLLEHLAEERRLEQRGVKQAGFAVLKSVDFPSVLVETAFINNPVEAKLLADPKFQKQLGKQLAEGVRSYFRKAGIPLQDPSSTATP
jgi:N-acetylmuramoyl-L-alanine amidase